MEKLKFNEWLEKYYNKKPHELNEKLLKYYHRLYLIYRDKDDDYDVIKTNDSDINATIDKLIADEEEAIRGYEEAMKNADEKHKALYSHIITEELEHIEELKNMKEMKDNLDDSCIKDVIKKESEGYVVYSEKGKKLSKPYKTEEEAKERLKEIEMFKHINKDSEIKDDAIDMDEVRENLETYLNWEGIIGYTDEIIEVWESKEAWIDDELKEFETPVEAMEAYLEWEGLWSYTNPIIAILEGGKMYIDYEDLDEDDLEIEDSKDDYTFHNGIQIFNKGDHYEFAWDDDVIWAKTLEEAEEQVDDLLYPERHYDDKPLYEPNEKLEKLAEEDGPEEYVIYAKDVYKPGESHQLYWTGKGSAKYSTEAQAKKFTKAEAEKVENYKGSHEWVKKYVGDSTDLIDLLSDCKDLLEKSEFKKYFTIYHKKDGDLDKIILTGSDNFEDTEEEEKLVEDLTDLIKTVYPNSKFEYNYTGAGGSWSLKE